MLQIQWILIQVHPYLSIVEVKMLRGTGLILDGNTGLILMAMVEKLNVTIAQRLWVEEYLDSNIILLELGKILNLVPLFQEK